MMGQAADDLRNGMVCSWCGVYFDDEHGYPVLCKECFDDNPDEANREEFQRATIKELGEDK